MTSTSSAAQPPTKRCGLATASLILGIVGPCTAGLAGVVGFILGIVALRRIQTSGGTLGGRRAATAGVVLGGISMVLLLLVLVCTPFALIVVRNEMRDWTAETWEKAKERRQGEEGDFFPGQKRQPDEVCPAPR